MADGSDLRMQLCNCGVPAARGFRNGQPTVYCGSKSSKCKFNGFIHKVFGYTLERPPRGNMPIIDLEACNHPVSNLECFTARLFNCDAAMSAALQRTFSSENLRGQAIVLPGNGGARTIFPLDQYQAFIALISEVHCGVQIAKIPDFFFRFYNALKDQCRQRMEDEESHLTQGLVTDDHVYKKLWPFQQRGVQFLMEHGGRGMIADVMGLGKTIQAIAVAHQYRTEWPVLVVCPVSLTFNWANEFVQWTDMPLSRIHTVGKSPIPSTADVVLVSYTMLENLERLRGGPDATPFKVVILDESHMIKSVDAKRSEQALRYCYKAKRCILLSGTPTPSRPFELFNQLRAIHGENFMKMDHFSARYCNSVRNNFGIDRTHNSYGLELNLLIRHSIIRRGKAEVDVDLPPKLRIRHWLQLSQSAKQQLSRDVSALAKAVAEKGDDAIEHHPNVLTMRLDTARAKMPAVKDYLLELMQSLREAAKEGIREKVILFGHHAEMMAALRSVPEDLNMDIAYADGAMHPADREKQLEYFRNEPKCQVAVLSMLSCGTGHNLTCANRVYFAELDWNPSNHLQSEDRVHRMGQKCDCVITYLVAEGTSDTIIWPMLDRKLVVTNSIIDNTNESTAFAASDKNRKTERGSGDSASSSAGGGGGGGGKQTTLDRHLVPKQPRAEREEEEDDDVVVISDEPTSKSSCQPIVAKQPMGAAAAPSPAVPAVSFDTTSAPARSTTTVGHRTMFSATVPTPHVDVSPSPAMEGHSDPQDSPGQIVNSVASSAATSAPPSRSSVIRRTPFLPTPSVSPPVMLPTVCASSPATATLGLRRTPFSPTVSNSAPQVGEKRPRE